MRNDDGYVMGVTVVLLAALGLFAAALVSVSAAELRRVRASEDRAAAQAAADAGVHRLAASLFAQSGRRGRGQTLPTSVEVNGRDVALHAAWEGYKVDLNTAELSVIDEVTEGLDLPVGAAPAFLAQVRATRGRGAPLRLIDDALLDEAITPSAGQRLRCAFTVFGGRGEPLGDEAPPMSSQPPAGSLITVTASVPADGLAPGAGVEAVLLATGDRRAPFLVMDWRRTSAGEEEACDA